MRKLVFLLFVVTSFGAAAQELEDVEPAGNATPAVMSRTARLHASPAGPSIGTVAAGRDVQVIGVSRTGWVRVRVGEQKGWIDRHFAKTEETNFSPKDFAMAADSKKASCFQSLDICPTVGCAEAGSSHAFANMAKHGPGSGTTAALPLTAFRTLQQQADTLVGEGAELDEADRKLLRKLKAGAVTTGEGHLVRISGFLIGKPHANSGESVNCKLSGSSSNDFHISIASGPGQTEFDSIVVEMIPQERNAAWTLTALNQVAKAKKRVVVVGQLFYDNVHRVNDNASEPLDGQPKRFSLWEVHPVSKFFVCTESGCNATTLKGYTPLEDVEFPL